MDNRAVKLANARKKLRDHQEKKSICTQKDEISDTLLCCETLIDVNDKDQSPPSKEESTLLNNNQDNIQVNNEEITRQQFNYHTINHEPVEDDEKCYTNVTEILISNKTNLEMQIKELHYKISNLEHVYSKELYENNFNKQKLSALELELSDACEKHNLLTESFSTQSSIITELQNLTKTLTDDNNNLKEQKEFTQTILTAKEMEIAQLNSQISVLQNQLDAMTLQLQQLTSDTNIILNQETSNNDTNESVIKKVTMLEHQLESLLKEKDHINSHYEHYVSKLNEQLRHQITKNEALSTEVKALHSRESALIEQIGQMEIRMQNYRKQTETYAESYNTTYVEELTDKVAGLQAELDKLHNKYSELQKEQEESLRIQELNETKQQDLSHENISISKLNADITSDKVAAQRATEQNKKLKIDVEELEQIVVKLGKDKLELTEKLSHEKQLNKQLMLKVAEIDETSTQMHTKLMAKDDEMIRLQANYRDIENKHETLLENLLQSKENAVTKKIIEDDANPKDSGLGEDEHNIHLLGKITQCSGDCSKNVHKGLENGNKLPKEDAMFKLQERFLNIMDQVANLSDEKHRLEHIILQLQTETDTICEYVALYQQQRSLLKKRDEERSAQIKLFQLECDEVKRQLEELSGLFLKLAQDKDLSAHLQVESRHNDVAKIKNLLENLLNSSLINSKCMSLELKNFYPCSCCSGQLIDV